MKSLGVLGGFGLLGSDLAFYLKDSFEITAIDKKNYQELSGKSFDFLINANGNSRRFWANQNIFDDFVASTVSVYKSLFDFQFKKYIYISSSDIYENHSTPKTTGEDQNIDPDNLCPYGFHKYLSEKIIQNNVKDYLILRCSLILGRKLKKGPVFDILNNRPLFITPDSRIQMIPTGEIAKIIKLLIKKSIKNEIFNLGGRGAFDFKKISDYFSKKLTISPKAEKQEYQMNVKKLAKIFSLKTSEEYFEKFITLIK